MKPVGNLHKNMKQFLAETVLKRAEFLSICNLNSANIFVISQSRIPVLFVAHNRLHGSGIKNQFCVLGSTDACKIKKKQLRVLNESIKQFLVENVLKRSDFL